LKDEVKEAENNDGQIINEEEEEAKEAEEEVEAEEVDDVIEILEEDNEAIDEEGKEVPDVTKIGSHI